MTLRGTHVETTAALVPFAFLVLVADAVTASVAVAVAVSCLASTTAARCKKELSTMSLASRARPLFATGEA